MLSSLVLQLVLSIPLASSADLVGFLSAISGFVDLEFSAPFDAFESRGGNPNFVLKSRSHHIASCCFDMMCLCCYRDSSRFLIFVLSGRSCPAMMYSL